MAENSWRIREMSVADYPGVMVVNHELYPDRPQTVEEWEEADRHQDPRCRHRGWVAETGDRIVGYGVYTHVMHKYDPHRFLVSGGVAGEYRGRGIGTALYDVVTEEMAIHRPRTLRSHAREDRRHAVRFLTSRGYREYRREQDSVLDVAEFDPAPYAGLAERLRSDGIVIMTLRELERDPDRDRKLYDLDWEVTRDEPGAHEDTRVDFATFVEKGLNASCRLLDGYFVAVHGGEYVGICILNAIEANGTASHGITGVKRRFRRRGVATALKVRAIEFARSTGIPRIYTDNEVSNGPMLTINRNLGFQLLPTWLFMEVDLSSDRGSG